MLRTVLAALLVSAACACSPKPTPPPEKTPTPGQQTSGSAPISEMRVEPGQWRTTIGVLEMNMAGVPAAAQQQAISAPTIVEDCVTSEDVREFAKPQTDGDCDTSGLSTAGGRISGTMSCAAEGMQMTQRIEGTYTPTRADLSISSETKTPSGPMSMKIKVVSERIGACKT